MSNAIRINHQTHLSGHPVRPDPNGLVGMFVGLGIVPKLSPAACVMKALHARHSFVTNTNEVGMRSQGNALPGVFGPENVAIAQRDIAEMNREGNLHLGKPETSLYECGGTFGNSDTGMSFQAQV